MTGFLESIIKDSGNEYASIVESGVEGSDVTGFINTGSHALNALLSGDIYKGMPDNKIIALAGESATGKTYFALDVCKKKHPLQCESNADAVDHACCGRQRPPPLARFVCVVYPRGERIHPG